MTTLLTDQRTHAQCLQDLLTALDTSGLPAARREDARALVLDSMRPTILWSSPRPGVHIIDGVQVDSTLIGLTAAHLAFCSPWRKVVRAADMTSPDTANADDVVRKALRVAARFIGPLSMRAAAAVRLVRVVEGFVTFAPDGRFDVEAS